MSLKTKKHERINKNVHELKKVDAVGIKLLEGLLCASKEANECLVELHEETGLKLIRRDFLVKELEE